MSEYVNPIWPHHDGLKWTQEGRPHYQGRGVRLFRLTSPHRDSLRAGLPGTVDGMCARCCTVPAEGSLGSRGDRNT